MHITERGAKAYHISQLRDELQLSQSLHANLMQLPACIFSLPTSTHPALQMQIELSLPKVQLV